MLSYLVDFIQIYLFLLETTTIIADIETVKI
jgi:hypothetical protein